MVDYSCLDGSKNPLNWFRIRLYKRKFYKAHPEYFRPDGLLMFCGAQGEGKTLSAVDYVKKLSWQYPAAKICTNVEIKRAQSPLRSY